MISVVLLLSVIWYLSPEAIESNDSNRVSEAQISQIIDARCVSCHASEPTQPGFAAAPLGILLDSPELILNQAERIAVTVQNRYMPIGNLTGMTDQERTTVAQWYAQVQQP